MAQVVDERKGMIRRRKTQSAPKNKSKNKHSSSTSSAEQATMTGVTGMTGMTGAPPLPANRPLPKTSRGKFHSEDILGAAEGARSILSFIQPK